MRLTFLLLLIGCSALAQSQIARPETALAALKLLPADRAANLVAIHGREGTPMPERWYLLTYDPAEENGVREFVVSANQLVASRGLSQFSELLRPADVIATEALKVDSDKVSQVAFAYAKANNLAIASINYQLKPDTGGVLIWKLVCFDSSGQPLGEMQIAAENGRVLSHEGFANEPKPATAPAVSAVSSAKPTPEAKPSNRSNSRPSPTPKNRSQGEGLGGKMKNFFSGH